MYSDRQINKFFNIAKGYSFMSDFSNRHSSKIGAIIAYKNRVISYGYNSTKQHPIQKEYNKYRFIDGNPCDVDLITNSLHAEMMALLNIRGFKGELSKCSIFIYREYKSGSMALVRPCEGCSKALNDYGIKNIYYTTNNGWNYERWN